MVDPVDELRAAAARLKRESDELVRKIEALPRPDVCSRGRDAPLTEEQALPIAQRAVNLYETLSPKPVQVTITQAAKMLGLSGPAVSKILKTGALRFNLCGKIPIGQIDLVLDSSRR